MIRHQFTLYLENKPGALARITDWLAEANVNIEGISTAESTDTALVQLIVDDSVKTKRILKKAKLAFTSQDVALVTLDHKPGELAKFARKVSSRHININYIYGTCGAGPGKSLLVVSTGDLKELEKMIK